MSQMIARLRHVPLGPIAAVLLGLAGAFVSWAVPANLLGAVMRHLHVTALLPAAAPPYSETTRVALAVLGGVVLGVAVLLVFRRLEGASRVDPVKVSDDAGQPPVLRRGDRHPDAPARRPLFATELLLVDPAPFQEEGESEIAEPSAAPSVAIEPSPADDAPVSAETAPVAAPASIVAAPRAELAPAPSPRVSVTNAPAAQPIARPVHGESVADLLARLEAGLARRAAPATPVEPAPEPAALGDALRVALADLQSMARR